MEAKNAHERFQYLEHGTTAAQCLEELQDFVIAEDANLPQGDEDIKSYFGATEPVPFIQVLATSGYNTDESDTSSFDKEIRDGSGAAAFLAKVDALYAAQQELRAVALCESTTSDFLRQCYALYRGTDLLMYKLVQQLQMNNFIEGGSLQSHFTQGGVGLGVLEALNESYGLLGLHKQRSLVDMSTEEVSNTGDQIKNLLNNDK